MDNDNIDNNNRSNSSRSRLINSFQPFVEIERMKILNWGHKRGFDSS